MLVENAEGSGYRVFMEVLVKEEYDKYYLGEEKIIWEAVDSRGFVAVWPELEEDGGHSVASTIIGDTLYLIEPSTDDVWSYGNLIR